MLKKLFNKCILINKWYYKTIVLNIGPRMHPVGPFAAARAPAQSARSRPLGAARLGPTAADTHQLIWGTWGTFKHFNLHQSVSIRFREEEKSLGARAPKFLGALKIVPKLVASDQKIGRSWMLAMLSSKLLTPWEA